MYSDHRLVSAVGTEVTPIGQRTTTLRGRLRTETAGWHDRTEAVADVPRSIRTRHGYAELLSRLYELHACFESRLAAPRFEHSWRSVGVETVTHFRTKSLAADLAMLGVRAPTGSMPSVPFATFGHALGCLYVLEGSSLGGHTVARIVRANLGEVPTTFLTGDGRSHPLPWLSLCDALARFETVGGDGDAVVSGACDIFAAFADHLSRELPTQNSRIVAPG